MAEPHDQESNTEKQPAQEKSKKPELSEKEHAEQSESPNPESSPSQQKDRSYLLVYIILFIVVFASLFFYLNWVNGPGAYTILSDGRVQYSIRPPVKFSRLPNETQENVTIEKVVIESKGIQLYGLLAIPSGLQGPAPAVIVMPGAGVSKEGEQHGLSADLNRLGFITLTLDLRGTGETGGSLLPWKQEVALFEQGKEPPTHKSFYDVLRAYDTLVSLPEVNAEKIYVAGESFGGRYALVIGGMEPGIKGVLAVSTSGFKLPPGASVSPYIATVNPDTYVSHSKNLIMIHSRNDSTIPTAYAEDTFRLATEPKSLFLIDKPGHGYDSGETFRFLKQALADWL